jgi:nicotinamidase-related amidase
MASIYLVLDMENDLIHDDGPNGKAGLGPIVRERGIIAKTKAAVAKARKAGVKIGYVRVGFSPDYRECPQHSAIFSRAREHGLFKLGTWGTEVHPELKPEPGDFDIVKHRVSPFYGTNLEPILRANGITRIYLSGVSTNAVVQGTMRDGHDRDYQCVLLEDCCAAITQAEHEAAVQSLARFGITTTSDKADFSS